MNDSDHCFIDYFSIDAGFALPEEEDVGFDFYDEYESRNGIIVRREHEKTCLNRTRDENVENQRSNIRRRTKNSAGKFKQFRCSKERVQSCSSAKQMKNHDETISQNVSIEDNKKTTDEEISEVVEDEHVSTGLEAIPHQASELLNISSKKDRNLKDLFTISNDKLVRTCLKNGSLVQTGSKHTQKVLQEVSSIKESTQDPSCSKKRRKHAEETSKSDTIDAKTLKGLDCNENVNNDADKESQKEDDDVIFCGSEDEHVQTCLENTALEQTSENVSSIQDNNREESLTIPEDKRVRTCLKNTSEFDCNENVKNPDVITNSYVEDTVRRPSIDEDDDVIFCGIEDDQTSAINDFETNPKEPACDRNVGVQKKIIIQSEVIINAQGQVLRSSFDPPASGKAAKPSKVSAKSLLNEMNLRRINEFESALSQSSLKPASPWIYVENVEKKTRKKRQRRNASANIRTDAGESFKVFRLDSLTALNTNRSAHHQEPLKCSSCDFATVLERELGEHRLAHSKRHKQYVYCEFCDFKASREGLEVHLRQNHDGFHCG